MRAAQNFLQGPTQRGEMGGGGRTKNETLFGGGSPRLFCTFTDSANVIFMLCFKINDAFFFFTFVF